jgi:hypothetical protein
MRSIIYILLFLFSTLNAQVPFMLVSIDDAVDTISLDADDWTIITDDSPGSIATTFGDLYCQIWELPETCNSSYDATLKVRYDHESVGDSVILYLEWNTDVIQGAITNQVKIYDGGDVEFSKNEGDDGDYTVVKYDTVRYKAESQYLYMEAYTNVMGSSGTCDNYVKIEITQGLIK